MRTSREDDVLRNMLDIARRIEKRVAISSRDEFLRDENLQLALAHLIQSIGEAARQLPETTRGQLPAIPWSLIIGMRHRIVHQYIEVDEAIVWETAVHDIPALIRELVRALRDVGDTSS